MPSAPVSIVMLAYNEAKTIEDELTSFHDIIASKLPGSELIVAEDGSTDGTTEIIQALTKKIPLIHRSSATRLGYAAALTQAVLSAKNEWVFFSDSGRKHDPHDFWRLYGKISDYDLIVGRKTNRKDQLYRQLLTRSYNLYLRTYFGLEGVYDADSGFKLFNQKVVEGVFKKGMQFKGLMGSELVLRTIFLGLRYTEVPVSYALREGESKGMPPRTIAKQIRRVLGDLARLKRERVTK
jgi:glycosyltransferase involved in cell wall biosynthesis